MNITKEELINHANQALSCIYDQLSGAEIVNLCDLPASATALLVIDMINGFAKEGALQSPRIATLIPRIERLMKKSHALGIPIVAFADSHPEDSPEFVSYPVHCLAGSSESEIVDELQGAAPYDLIKKNSTNGALAADFKQWQSQHPQIANFVLVGDCTDICVLQLALWLKASAHEGNQSLRVIVPINATDTYDLGPHQGDLMHIMALYNMQINGVEVVAAVE